MTWEETNVISKQRSEVVMMLSLQPDKGSHWVACILSLQRTKFSQVTLVSHRKDCRGVCKGPHLCANYVCSACDSLCCTGKSIRCWRLILERAIAFAAAAATAAAAAAGVSAAAIVAARVG